MDLYPYRDPRPRTWAMPVQVNPHESLAPLNSDAIVPATAPMDTATSEMNPLTPGVFVMWLRKLLLVLQLCLCARARVEIGLRGLHGEPMYPPI